MAKAHFENDKNDNGVDDTFEDQMANEVFNDDNHDEEAPEAQETPEEVNLPESKPCRDENEHPEHLWGSGYFCEGRRRG